MAFIVEKLIVEKLFKIIVMLKKIFVQTIYFYTYYVTNIIGLPNIKPHNKLLKFYYFIQCFTMLGFNIWCLNKKILNIYIYLRKTAFVLNTVIDILCIIIYTYNLIIVIYFYGRECKKFKNKQNKINKFLELKGYQGGTDMKRIISIVLVQIWHFITLINFYFYISYKYSFIYDISHQFFNVYMLFFVLKILFYATSLKVKCEKFNRDFEDSVRKLRKQIDNEQITILLNFLSCHQDICGLFDIVTKVYGVQILIVVKIITLLLVVYIQDLFHGSGNNLNSFLWIVFYLVCIKYNKKYFSFNIC